MEDQAASLRRLTPSAQVGRSFAFLGVSGCGTTTVVAEMAAGLVAAQRRVLILDAHPGNPLAQRFVDDPGVTLDMVVNSQGSLDDTVTPLPFGSSVMNVYTRPNTLAHLSDTVERRLVSEYEALARDVELVLIDTPSVGTDPALAALARREQDLQREIASLAESIGNLLARGRVAEQDTVVAEMRAVLARLRDDQTAILAEIEQRFLYAEMNGQKTAFATFR